jgi:hypothetical protein
MSEVEIQRLTLLDSLRYRSLLDTIKKLRGINDLPSSGGSTNQQSLEHPPAPPPQPEPSRPFAPIPNHQPQEDPSQSQAPRKKIKLKKGSKGDDTPTQDPSNLMDIDVQPPSNANNVKAKKEKKGFILKDKKVNGASGSGKKGAIPPSPDDTNESISQPTPSQPQPLIPPEQKKIPPIAVKKSVVLPPNPQLPLNMQQPLQPLAPQHQQQQPQPQPQQQQQHPYASVGMLGTHPQYQMLPNGVGMFPQQAQQQQRPSSSSSTPQQPQRAAGTPQLSNFPNIPMPQRLLSTNTQPQQPQQPQQGQFALQLPPQLAARAGLQQPQQPQQQRQSQYPIQFLQQQMRHLPNNNPANPNNPAPIPNLYNNMMAAHAPMVNQQQLLMMARNQGQQQQPQHQQQHPNPAQQQAQQGGGNPHQNPSPRVNLNLGQLPQFVPPHIQPQPPQQQQQPQQQQPNPNLLQQQQAAAANFQFSQAQLQAMMGAQNLSNFNYAGLQLPNGWRGQGRGIPPPQQQQNAMMQQQQNGGGRGVGRGM